MKLDFDSKINQLTMKFKNQNKLMKEQEQSK